MAQSGEQLINIPGMYPGSGYTCASPIRSCGRHSLYYVAGDRIIIISKAGGIIITLLFLPIYSTMLAKHRCGAMLARVQLHSV